ncbi:OPT oligopeptide transporter protein-domain-containing protein [Bombardia bombarda]|uniref:OPT oligopeptide transporter protein-domain-containing protein n=1 Tax=Bombardia bombarda TaxID=252184 RepID=A0AA39WGQ0_9PEZI|nr:OPT oligopeptide transporter protein-domain-containing protein [Bombardia bombarda]
MDDIAPAPKGIGTDSEKAGLSVSANTSAGPGSVKSEDSYRTKSKGNNESIEGLEKTAVQVIDPEIAAITEEIVLDTALELVTKTLDITDNPNEYPYTVRAFAIGIALAAFGAALSEIYYFKPQTIGVHTIMLVILSFCIGEATRLIPVCGPITRLLNPGPFNQKEHVFSTIIASSASTTALGTMQLAAQSLYYGNQPNAASSIFMLLSSQCIGYGLLATYRKTFIYPTKCLWPSRLPLASIFQSMHLDKGLAKKRLRIFWIICVAVMVWEIFPQYIFPLTSGISIFCLVNQNSALFTRIFGGSNGDEGMGLLSWSMDWVNIGTTEFYQPLGTQVNIFIGYIISIIVLLAAYYGNLWNAQQFPFMSQMLFRADGTVYDQTMILGENNQVDADSLRTYGLPWYSTSNALFLLGRNMGVTSGIVHLLLWNWSDVGFMFPTSLSLADIRKQLRSLGDPVKWKFWHNSEQIETQFPGTAGDPHYEAMKAYKDAPSWWYYIVLILASIIGLVCSYQQDTGLPWWAFFISIGLAWLFTGFNACLDGIFGFYTETGTIIQMIGGFLVPGLPVANMMFMLYGSNSIDQAIGMLADLKLAQYCKLPPRAVFIAQMTGTCLGAVINWVVMNSIVESQRDILLSVEGTNIWSGQQVQSYNSDAVTWGATIHVFSVDGEYFMVAMGLLFGLFAPLPFYFAHRFFPTWGFNNVDTFIILTWLGGLSVGINSTLMPMFTIGFFVQGYLRKKRPVLYAKWNYTVAASIAGAISLISFILVFAVQGGAGEERPFPIWWGNNAEGNMDRCKKVHFPNN